MPRYIDADKLIRDLIDNRSFYPAIVKSAIENAPTEYVVPRSEGGAECPTCHGTGRIGTTDWLTKHLTKEQLAEKKAQAIEEATEELERKAKQEVAKAMIDEFEFNIEYMHKCAEITGNIMFYWETLKAELKKKYIGE